MSNYGERRMLSTKAEKLLPAYLTYILRKILLYYCRLQFWKVRQVSKVYGFHVRTEVEDAEAWKWYVRSRIPMYSVDVEKKN